MAVIRTLSVLVVVLSALAASVSALSYEKLHLIDWVQGPTATHYVFRSDEPVSKNPYTFQYDQLVGYMAQRAKNASAPWHDATPFVFDWCTLNFLKAEERDDITAERNFFDKNKTLGEFHNWVIIGNLLDPNNMEASQVQSSMDEYIDYDPDQLVKRIGAIRSRLESATNDTSTRSQVTLIHCEGGDDRTGEVSAAYVMQYKNYTLKQALQWDDSIAHRNIEFMSRNGAMWYCWYLTYRLGYTNLNCADAGQ